MHRIDNPSAATSLPLPKPAGPDGYFTAGNVTTGQEPTIVEYDWLNTIQEELAIIVQRGGLTLDKSNNTQVLQALGSMLTGAYTFATVTQDIPVPAWATRIEFEITAGGGGGAHCQSDGTNYRSGAGGGAGAYAQAMRNVTAGTVIHAIIGNGGATDVAGATSSLAFTGQWTVSCTGGQPGIWTSPFNSAGGIGGTASGADLNAGGTCGGDGIANNVYASTGYGGAGPWGGGGRSGNGGGAFGAGPGSGGGGAYDNTNSNTLKNGGRGANGMLKYRFLP